MNRCIKSHPLIRSLLLPSSPFLAALFLPFHLSNRDGIEVKHDNETFFSCWPNRSSLLNSGWDIEQRGEVGKLVAQWWNRLASLSSHHGSNALKSFTCPSLPLILLCLCFWQTLFPCTTLPLPINGLFGFLMSLYLVLLDRRNVSEAFCLEQHFSCHLGHFSHLPHAAFSQVSHLYLAPLQGIHYNTLDALVEWTRAKNTLLSK